MRSITTNYYSGTSGLVLPVPKALYPAEYRDKSRLTYYASLFNSIEINSSFYKTPRVRTVVNWSESVPDHFQFTFKLSKLITHPKSFQFDAEDIKQFISVINHIGSKQGCLLIQLPPGVTVERSDQLRKLLANIQAAGAQDWKLAIEFRSNSWYNNDTYALLEQYHAAMVMHDLPKSATPSTISNTDFQYLRFHGPGGGYRGSYDNDFLLSYATSVSNWLHEGKAVYVYFNNTMGDALNNLQTFNHLVAEELTQNRG